MTSSKEQHEFRTVRIEGVTARAMALIQNPSPPRNPERPREMMSVRDAIDADKAMSDPDNMHHCPLCNDEFGTAAFAAHASECIDKHAPRMRVWLPPGIQDTIQEYSEERPRRPGGGVYGAY